MIFVIVDRRRPRKNRDFLRFGSILGFNSSKSRERHRGIRIAERLETNNFTEAEKLAFYAGMKFYAPGAFMSYENEGLKTIPVVEDRTPHCSRFLRPKDGQGAVLRS